MEAGPAQVPNAPLLTGLPDPDAWSARWTLALVVVSLVAWFLPVPAPKVSDSRAYIEEYLWYFPWELTESRSLVVQLVQPIAALAAFWIVRRYHGARRGIALLLVAFTAFLASSHLPWKRPTPPGFAPGAGEQEFAVQLLKLSLLLGTIGVAVGNHLRKRAPEASLGRALCGAGGVVLIGAYFVPIGGTTLMQSLFDREQLGTGWPSALVHVLLLAYALLGVRQVFADSGYAWRCTAVSRLARVLLVVPPLASTAAMFIFYQRTTAHFRPDLHILLVMQAKEWGQLVAIFAPLGVGLAAWLEARSPVRGPAPAAPAAMP